MQIGHDQFARTANNSVPSTAGENRNPIIDHRPKGLVCVPRFGFVVIGRDLATFRVMIAKLLTHNTSDSSFLHGIRYAPFRAFAACDVRRKRSLRRESAQSSTGWTEIRLTLDAAEALLFVRSHNISAKLIPAVRFS